MSDAGARLIDLSFPGAEEIRPTFATIQMAEAHHVHSSVMGIFPRRASEYGADVRGRLEMSADITLADYLSALEAKRALRHRFARLFDESTVGDDPDNGWRTVHDFRARRVVRWHRRGAVP